MFATATGIKVGAKLQPLLKKAGRADEAMLLGFQMAEWAARRDRQFKETPTFRSANWKTVGWDGLTIQVIALMVVPLSAMFVVSQVIVWLGRRRTLEQRGRSYSFLGGWRTSVHS